MPEFHQNRPVARYSSAVARSGFSRNLATSNAPEPAICSPRSTYPRPVCGWVGSIPKVHSARGRSSTSANAVSTEARNSFSGVIRWSAVTMASTASGSSRPTTAEARPTALEVSRPTGSPISRDGSSSGSCSSTCDACAEAVHT